MRRRHIFFRQLFVATFTMLLWTTCGYADDSVADAAASVGLTPESMVVADIDIAQVAPMLTAVQSEVELRQSLNAQHAAADVAAVNVTNLSELLQQSPDDEQLVAQHEAALNALQTAKDQIEALRGELFESATAPASADQITKLLVWRSGDGFRVPPEFRAVERTEDEWRAIEAALRAESRALRLNEELDELHAQLLNNVRSQAAVIDAGSRLQTDLQAVQTLFEQLAD
jgi:hypothetical protein